jgi:hypothetical protein
MFQANLSLWFLGVSHRHAPAGRSRDVVAEAALEGVPVGAIAGRRRVVGGLGLRAVLPVVHLARPEAETREWAARRQGHGPDRAIEGMRPGGKQSESQPTCGQRERVHAGKSAAKSRRARDQRTRGERCREHPRHEEGWDKHRSINARRPFVLT